MAGLAISSGLKGAGTYQINTGRGILAGINQTLLWILEPDDWAEPLSTIPRLMKARGE